MDKLIKLIIADDQTLYREGVKNNLEKHSFVVSEAADGKELMKKIQQEHPIVVLLDLQMPIMDGFQCLPIIVRDYPNTKVIVVTFLSITKETLKGCHGLVKKEISTEDLVYVINEVVKNGSYFNPAFEPRLAPRSEFLTAEEREIIRLVANEYTSEEIAVELGVTKRSVDSHRARILEKTNVKNVVGLTKLAQALGLI